jgi:hypothetical protein
MLCLLALVIGCSAAAAATLETTTGEMAIDIKNTRVVFLPDPEPNLAISATFETAVPGDTVSGMLDVFNFATFPTDFETGRYVITMELRPAPLAAISLSLIGPDTFTATSFVPLLATFTYDADNGCGDSCGDVLGEFGSVPGLDNCVGGGGVATCEVAGRFNFTGNYAFGPGGITALTNVTVEPAAVPEPSSLLLMAFGSVAILLRRRHFSN